MVEKSALSLFTSSQSYGKATLISNRARLLTETYNPVNTTNLPNSLAILLADTASLSLKEICLCLG